MDRESVNLMLEIQPVKDSFITKHDNMKHSFFALIASLFSLTGQTQQPALSLVPWPVEVKQSEGVYLLKNSITVSNNFPNVEWTKLFSYFKKEMNKQFGITVTEALKGKAADISFGMKRMPTSGKPAYQLSVSADGISIYSNFDEPAFHAMQTLFQLIPADKDAKKEVPFVEIFDHARFAYRGMHLDVSRHFFSVYFVKKYIDYLAYHKINKFHWHLTEDQGWRIEINKYPGLTKVGGYRNGTIIGRYPGNGNDNFRYGGFYTQKEVKEIVQYAKDRFIDVIPEIEMPGHAGAAIAAYPWLSCFPDKPTDIPFNMKSDKSIAEQKAGRIKLVQETWGVFDDVFCAGNDATFVFLQNVIDEVTALFPSKYFHIGGDECPKTHWKACPKCQQRMKENNLKDEHELQSWFVQKIEKYLNSKGKTMIGWDEILEGGLAPNAVVMSWRGEAGGIEAAKQKHNVIMTPGNPVYFDYSQSTNEDSVTIGGYNPIEKVYAYEPVPKELTAEEAVYVLGAQANVWTEYMKKPEKVEYMVFPRMAALSEVLWSPKENKSWESFEKRLQTQFRRYDLWKANYSKAYFDLKATVLATEDYNGVLWKLESKAENGYIGYPPALLSSAILKYSEPFKIQDSEEKSASFFVNDKPISSISQSFHFNKATGKKITLKEQPSSKYPGDGAFTLVNGVQNTRGLARSREFIGFEGKDCEAIIDLGAATEINEIVIHQLDQPASWIYAPAQFDIAIATDGENFSPMGVPVSIVRSADKDKTTLKLDKPVTTRYLKLVIFNHGIIPAGAPGAGSRSWLFLDEIEVN